MAREGLFDDSGYDIKDIEPSDEYLAGWGEGLEDFKFSFLRMLYRRKRQGQEISFETMKEEAEKLYKRFVKKDDPEEDADDLIKAIEQEKSLQRANVALYNICALKESNKHFLREADKHEQKARWLEELQELREKQSAKTSNKCERCRACDDLK